MKAIARPFEGGTEDQTGVKLRSLARISREPLAIQGPIWYKRLRKRLLTGEKPGDDEVLCGACWGFGRGCRATG